MKKIFRNNGLSIVFFLLFIISLVGQVVMGLKEHNQQMQEEGGKILKMSSYLLSEISTTCK